MEWDIIVYRFFNSRSISIGITRTREAGLREHRRCFNIYTGRTYNDLIAYNILTHFSTCIFHILPVLQ